MQVQWRVVPFCYTGKMTVVEVHGHDILLGEKLSTTNGRALVNIALYSPESTHYISNNWSNKHSQKIIMA